MPFDFTTLITDRVQADIAVLESLLGTPMSDWTEEQLAEFNLSRSKGAYNYTDLNRVTEAMDYINDRLVGYGYATGYQKIKIPRKGSGKLPEGYTELEYIQSSGTQYIDTGFKPDSNTRVLMEVTPIDSGLDSWIFSARTARLKKELSCAIYFAQNKEWAFCYGQKETKSSISSEEKTLIDFNKNVVSLNSNSITLQNYSFSCEYNLFLLCNNTAGETKGYASATVYFCKIYDNGLLVRDFIPCKNSSGKVGLFDLISQKIYSNAGAGEFTAGPEVPQPEPTLDPHTWYEDDIPTVGTMTAYLANVAALRSALAVWADTPSVPADMAGLTYQEANDIEKILVDVESVINQVVSAMARSNSFTFWSGNRPFPTAESNLGRTWAKLDAMNTEWKNWQVATWYLLLYGNLQAEGVVS